MKDDGVFCQWAQLYEMSSKNIKTILRSFAEVFPYTYVFSAEDLSSDVIMVAANHPLGLDLPRLRKSWNDARLAAELKRGGIGQAEDLAAQLLLTPEEIPAFTAGSPLNTDDDAIIEFNAPRDLLGSTRTSDPYLARVYASEWPYGRLDAHLVYGPDRGGDELALSKSLLRHGKRAAAERFLKRALGHGATPGSDTERIVRALGERGVEDREVPLSDAEHPELDSGLAGLDPPRYAAGTSEADQAKVAADWLEVERSVRARAWAHALYAMRKWPEKWIDEAGPDVELLVGYLMYKADLCDEAVDRLKPLTDEAGFVSKRPALLYYLARAEYGAAIFEPAVRNMEKFLSASR
jgi:hypothetical protein